MISLFTTPSVSNNHILLKDPNELWVNVPGFGGKLAASNIGRIRKLYEPTITNTGDGGSYIHRVVADGSILTPYTDITFRYVVHVELFHFKCTDTNAIKIVDRSIIVPLNILIYSSFYGIVDHETDDGFANIQHIDGNPVNCNPNNLRLVRNDNNPQYNYSYVNIKNRFKR